MMALRHCRRVVTVTEVQWRQEVVHMSDVPGEVDKDGELVPYGRRSTKHLMLQASVYEESVKDVIRHETHGHWYYQGQFYGCKADAEFAYWNSGRKGALPVEYDALEDLAFLYTELGKVYEVLMDRKHPNKYAPLTQYLLGQRTDNERN
jgi:hypothetical protein